MALFLVSRRGHCFLARFGIYTEGAAMGDVVTTMTAIVVANAILLPLTAYACMRCGLLPGVDWYWPFQGRRDENLDPRAVEEMMARRALGEIVATFKTDADQNDSVQVAVDAPPTDTLMQSADGKLYLIPLPLEPFEVRDEADILELRREAKRVPPRDITSVQSLPARPASHVRTSLYLSWIAARLAAKRSALR
jgi:hypothetical protein